MLMYVYIYTYSHVDIYIYIYIHMLMYMLMYIKYVYKVCDCIYGKIGVIIHIILQVCVCVLLQVPPAKCMNDISRACANVSKT